MEGSFSLNMDFHLQNAKCWYFKGCKPGSDQEVARTEDNAGTAKRALNAAILVNARVNVSLLQPEFGFISAPGSIPWASPLTTGTFFCLFSSGTFAGSETQQLSLPSY